MVTAVAIFVMVLVLSFSFVLLFGAPYLPTLDKQVQVALDLADLEPGQTILELGCGDGKVLLAAAARGWSVIGYELNPILALIAWLRTRRYGRSVRVICASFWKPDLPPANAVFVFLLDRFMPRLDRQLTAYQARRRQASESASTADRPKPIAKLKLVSFAFQIPGKQPIVAKDGIFLYHYD